MGKQILINFIFENIGLLIIVFFLVIGLIAFIYFKAYKKPKSNWKGIANLLDRVYSNILTALNLILVTEAIVIVYMAIKEFK